MLRKVLSRDLWQGIILWVGQDFHTEFEENLVYLRKIEEALRTLHAFEGELNDYSPLLHARNILRKFHLLGAFRKFHALCKGWELMNLCSNMPSLFIFKLYKLGYYVSR